jgi:hypothetical protein
MRIRSNFEEVQMLVIRQTNENVTYRLPFVVLPNRKQARSRHKSTVTPACVNGFLNRFQRYMRLKQRKACASAARHPARQAEGVEQVLPKGRDGQVLSVHDHAQIIARVSQPGIDSSDPGFDFLLSQSGSVYPAGKPARNCL